MDYLIEAGVVSIETKDRIVSHVTRQDRCRAVLDELLASSHRQAFVVLYRALGDHYPWIVNTLQQEQEQPNDELDVVDLARRLRDLERLNMQHSLPITALDKVTNNQPFDRRKQFLENSELGESLLKKELSELQAQHATVQAQLVILKESDAALRLKVEELTKVEIELREKLKQAKAREDDLQRQLSEAESHEFELQLKLEESTRREQILKTKIEQAAVIEQLLRLEVKQAIEDERSLAVCNRPNNNCDDIDETGGVQLSASASTTVPTLLQTLSGSIAVYGLTTIHGQLFVARDRTSIIEVYDVITLLPGRSLTVSHPSAPKPPRPLDMTSCQATSSLYVMDYANCRIHRMDPRVGEVTDSWRVDGQAWGLSTTTRSTVLVSCRGSGRLLEYTSTGQLVREVVLQPSVECPVHAVELDQGLASAAESARCWIVCYHEGSHTAPCHGVCAVDASGSILRVHGSLSGESPELIAQPHHMALTGDGKLLVADCGNNRIRILDTATLKAVVSGPTSGRNDLIVMRPHRLNVCQPVARMFVGLWDGCVLVYQLRTS
jgi:hypothetical protein